MEKGRFVLHFIISSPSNSLKWFFSNLYFLSKKHLFSVLHKTNLLISPFFLPPVLPGRVLALRRHPGGPQPPRGFQPGRDGARRHRLHAQEAGVPGKREHLPRTLVGSFLATQPYTPAEIDNVVFKSTPRDYIFPGKLLS